MSQDERINSALSLKITLVGTRPVVWRRVLIPVDVSLGYLHDVIQGAMGWENCHLYDFMTGRGRRSSLSYQLRDESGSVFYKTAVRSFLPREKSTIVYLYDFGDGWQHKVVLEKVVEIGANQSLPVCLAGKNACPPEDCGGIGGYYSKLEALADSDDEYHDEVIEWMGEDFDPAFFDLEKTNRFLSR